ncbi:hypothetical protein BO70DRAFT_132531 [Aspergillus heteromorphus CBS 117.55]|uniref:Uncharacterized protein n=1 Tax=Aspergillus heteromorphus CBS 117.55 TaxID=1448321 RepID=A0A317WUH3_9EURO|nr:uncharacterized protein BO70DRAFT_132531 [Aspergillus heteromorphus CBS 117.55]PWY90006.1 hypothetical protein BO70DRAFT_132531 [Aspergillus heteromorphus CBS 117.55]
MYICTLCLCNPKQKQITKQAPRTCSVTTKAPRHITPPQSPSTPSQSHPIPSHFHPIPSHPIPSHPIPSHLISSQFISFQFRS